MSSEPRDKPGASCPFRDADSSDEELVLEEPEFYDEALDEKDEVWMEKKRKGRQSDAILSCPGCFTTLCVDCQRHEKYVTQYRAVFALNCNVVESQRLRFPAENKTRRKSRNPGKTNLAQAESTIGSSKVEVYKPVCCSVCNTEVAVMDDENVYHFFNILPSYS